MTAHAPADGTSHEGSWDWGRIPGNGNGRRVQSLKWQLILRLLTLQAGILVVVVAVLFWSGVLFNFETADNTIEVLEGAVERDPAGSLRLGPTPALTALRASVPNLWFVVRDRQGHRLSEGVIPPEFAEVGDALDRVGQARLGWNIWDPPDRPTARIRWVDTAAGSVQIMTGSEGKASLYMIALGVSLVFVQLVLPIFAIIAAGILIATPIVVRGALAGLSRAAAEAERIDIDRRGKRLTADGVPAEVVSLIKAINDALGRLDEGYERHQRFLADAAHELRTPVAILSARIASLPPGEEKTRLGEDTARLAILTEQLLDLQRLDRQADHFQSVDLVEMSRQVVLDLAPLGFAAGYEMAFQPEAESAVVSGDVLALERALTNLVQNAIDHGGRRGTITIRVLAPGTVEVCDEGDGIPADAREQIFEPFHRLRPQNRGAGLGLNLVRAIVQLHGGRVAAVDGPSGGACLRMSFPDRSGP